MRKPLTSAWSQLLTWYKAGVSEFWCTCDRHVLSQLHLSDLRFLCLPSLSLFSPDQIIIFFPSIKAPPIPKFPHHLEHVAQRPSPRRVLILLYVGTRCRGAPNPHDSPGGQVDYHPSRLKGSVITRFAWEYRFMKRFVFISSCDEESPHACRAVAVGVSTQSHSGRSPFGRVGQTLGETPEIVSPLRSGQDRCTSHDTRISADLESPPTINPSHHRSIFLLTIHNVRGQQYACADVDRDASVSTCSLCILFSLDLEASSSSLLSSAPPSTSRLHRLPQPMSSLPTPHPPHLCQATINRCL